MGQGLHNGLLYFGSYDRAKKQDSYPKRRVASIEKWSVTFYLVWQLVAVKPTWLDSWLKPEHNKTRSVAQRHKTDNHKASSRFPSAKSHLENFSKHMSTHRSPRPGGRSHAFSCAQPICTSLLRRLALADAFSGNYNHHETFSAALPWVERTARNKKDQYRVDSGGVGNGRGCCCTGGGLLIFSSRGCWCRGFHGRPCRWSVRAFVVAVCTWLFIRGQRNSTATPREELQE